MHSTAITSWPRYCLRGQVEGASRTFVLDVGLHRVGSSTESDVFLPVRGVSREHALIVVTPEGLSVEDRGSKNGTLVDGEPIERHSLSRGSRVEFGPVGFEVDEVEADDFELAVVVDLGPRDPDSEAAGSQPSVETASLGRASSRPVAEVWLQVATSFFDRLFTDSGVDPRGALFYLIESLGADGGCLLEWNREGDPLVLASRGRVGVPPPPAYQDRSDSFQTSPEVTFAYLDRQRSASPGLVVWGDFPGRSESERLFRLLLRYLERTVESPAAAVAADAGPRAAYPDLVFPETYVPCVSAPMRALYRQMAALLDRDLPVLFVGETGVGKERLVSIFHRSSKRRDGPQVSINCAAIPAELLEAELFGIGKGVATGVQARPGKFQQAQGGTLFLDEIGEMMPSLQAKLLRVLQEKQVQPVGGRPQPVDARIVAATNANLEQRMERGEFRRDLYYRLAGYVLEVPALRECRDDVPLLVEHFLNSIAGEAGLRLRGMTVKALGRLSAYSWPGNVRELQHEIRRLVYLCEGGGVIDVGMLPERLTARDSASLEGRDLEYADLQLEPRCRELETRLIQEALRRAEGMQVRAAGLLGISRNGLADKIKRLGIDVHAFRGA